MSSSITASRRTDGHSKIHVPLLDLKAQHAAIATEIGDGIDAVFDEGAFAGGPFVEKFEKEFAVFCGSRYASGVGSGTEALWLALLALGIGPGDEVITVANTFFATAEAITMVGAEPVFVDVDERTYTMDPSLIEPAITNRTKAILPVHLYGHMADMRSIMKVAEAHGLYVVEDACQAHGAIYHGRNAGTIGHVGCFSFYPTKNLGACGEAGAVVTDDPAVDDAVKMLRDHGQRTKHDHRRVGWNCRMDGIQAAILSAKLPRVEQWNELRRAAAQEYNALLEGCPEVVLPLEAPGCRHVYHLYVVRTSNRTELEHRLDKAGIGHGVHYPTPIHLQEAYRYSARCGSSMMVTERCAGQIISLPMFPGLTTQQTKLVCDVVASGLTNGRKDYEKLSKHFA